MRLAQEVGFGTTDQYGNGNSIFKLADIIPFDEVIPLLKRRSTKSYGHKSMAIVEKNIQAIDRTIELLHEVVIPENWKTLEMPEKINKKEQGYVQRNPWSQ